MSCFYCGKRVSLVRKRSDADFCCDDHREKYHARTLRTIETLREADEQIAVTRRLNEGMPLRPCTPLLGREPASLLQRNPGSPQPFGWMPTGLPISRAIVDVHVPAGALYAFRSARSDGAVPAPSAEHLGWSIGHVQEGPRPPRAFTMGIRLPQGGPKRAPGKYAAFDRPRPLRSAPGEELGEAARTVARRLAWRPAAKSIGVTMRAVNPPDPVPPPPLSPIAVNLRHPTMPLRLARRAQSAAIALRMPSGGTVGIRSIAPAAGERPPSPAFVRMEPRTLAIPETRIGPGSMPRLREIRWGNRFVPSPDGFRRRQFYSWEALERFCGMAFDTIAGHRPEIRIEAAPQHGPAVAVVRLWTAPIQDPVTAQPERRRPAPPFPERLGLPAAVASTDVSGLLLASTYPVEARTLDSPYRFPNACSRDSFAAFDPVRRQALPTRIPPAHWATGTAEPFAIPAWARPQTRGSKRTACDLGIGVRTPVFHGPEFQSGDRRAGPTPPKLVSPPVFEPAATHLRSEMVEPVFAALLPALPVRDRLLGEAAILASACRAPVGHIPARRIMHPAHAIPLPIALPSGALRPTAAGSLRIHAPAPRGGTSFNIAKGSPRMLDAESLQRFRRRGFEAMHSRPATPRWPASSVPGPVVAAAHTLFALRSGRPAIETALGIFRGHVLPRAGALRLTCTVQDWQLLAPPLPGCADWGRTTHTARVGMPLPLVLPADALGPIRDWGLLPPPEPEKPPEPIHEDFGAGLANWVCANPDWRQDIAGVRTGSLALLRPSLNMRDYEFEFLCKIENRSIGCVFRAVDTANYHALQIALDPSSGAAHLARFSLIGGECEQPAIAPLDMPLGKSSSCRIKMSVSGNEFKLFVNDKPAFDWMDDRLPEGGVGFFSDGEDRARLYWVKVTPYFAAQVVEAYPRIAPPGAEIHREIRMGV